MRASRLVLPTVILLTVGFAAPAQAVVTVSGSQVYGDAANDFISVSCAAGVLAASGGGTGDPCASMTSLFVTGGGGTDSINLAEVTAADFPALISVGVDVDEISPVPGAADTVNGSPGDDTISGDSLDVLNGQDGNDAITGGGSVSGGLGDDTIVEFLGNGTPNGGPGDDRFIQFLTLGGVEGGPGFDSYELDLDRSSPRLGADLTIRLTADTMRVIAGPTDATLPIGGIELLDFTLLRGDTQTWEGADFAGMQRVRGMAGVDHIIGGALDDELFGGGGDDTVTGNGGVDLLRGGDGNDTIQARDGLADRVDCGAGVDTVVADAVDVVVNCETVQLPPVVTPPVVTPPVVTPPAAVVPETSAIKGRGKVSKPKKATFRFSSPTAGATFQCKVDRSAWKSCTSPYKVKTRKLKPGKHKIRVRAVVGGAVDTSPAKKVFRVRKS